MPSPKRWHPVSRDANDDPELWEFTDRFGDRSIRIWLEVFAQIDRHENNWRLIGDCVGTLSRKCRASRKKVRAAIEWMIQKEWLEVLERDAEGFSSVLAARNYWKYHKRREPNGAMHGHQTEATRDREMAPSYPNLPNLS